MLHKILLPVDLTEKNRPALDAARELLKKSGSEGEVVLLHVIAAIADTSFEEMSDFYQPIEDDARQRLGSLAEELSTEGIPVSVEVLYGDRARSIVEYAAEAEVGLIVLSSRTLDERDPAANWATVSLKVAFLADCPVMLVK